MAAYKSLTPIWDSLPVNIMWQKHHRDNDDFGLWEQNVQNVREGINMSIILNTASMVEGYLEEKIRDVFLSKFTYSPITNSDKLKVNDFAKKLEKATFSKYSNLYKSTTGKSLSSLLGTSSNLWVDIEYLFKLRNIIGHSQSLETFLDVNAGTKTAAQIAFEGKFDDIIKYLQNYSLLLNPIPEGMYFKTMFFGDTTADYFYQQAKEFINCLDKELEILDYQSNSRLRGIFKEFIR